MLFRWPRRSALPIAARCSDDLAAAHYSALHEGAAEGLPKGSQGLGPFMLNGEQEQE